MSKSEVLDRILRAVVTLAFTGACIYGFLLDKVSAEAFIGFVGMVLVYWFSQRSGSRDRASDQPASSPTPAANGPSAPTTPPRA